MKTRLESLIERAEQIASDDAPRRRVELVERAVAQGHSIEYADQIYDIAEEEHLDPAFAFELVLNRIGVRELAEPTDDAYVETQVEAPPEWVAEPDPSPIAAAHERHMRNSFRRLRRMFEQHGTPTAALQAFANEPDVAEIEY